MGLCLKLFLLSFLSLFMFNGHGAWETLNFMGSEVFVYTPGSVSRSNTQASLMVNLHGCAQKASVLKDHGNWQGAAEKFRTIVAIPQVPNGGVIAGCWDYYGLNHNSQNRHNKFIIELTKELIGTLNVDSSKVFLSGLSSGAGLSMVLGCLRPDLFKGIGLNAGPSVGTGSGDISRARISVETIINNCRELSGERASFLKDIKVSTIYGNNDFLVDPEYNRRNASAFSEMTESTQQQSFDPSTFPGTRPQGSGYLYFKGERAMVSVIENTGLGHNWPAGQGGSPRSFVSKTSLDYPYYLLNFLLN